MTSKIANEINEEDMDTQPPDESRLKVDNKNLTDDDIPTPPDGGWGWIIVFASFMCNTIVDGIGYAFGVFLPEFVSYFDEPRSKVSLIGSLLCGTYLLVGPIVSGLINKFGCRSVSMAGGVVSATAFVLARFSPNVDVLILTYGFMGGFGFGMIYLPSVISVGFYFERKRAVATGIAVCGSGVGTFIFAPLTKVLLDQYDWKNALFIIAGIAFNACVCGSLLRPLLQNVEPLDGLDKYNDKETKESIDMEDEFKEEKAELDFLNAVGSRSQEREELILPKGVYAREIKPLIKRPASGQLARSEPIRVGRSAQNLTGSKTSLKQRELAGPMARKDIFYSGSIQNISDIKTKSLSLKNRECTEDHFTDRDHSNSKCHKLCPCLPSAVVDVLSDILDVSLLTNVGFICICLGNILSMAGFYVPYVYIVDRALLAGVDKTEASILLSVIGITNTIGRIIFGLLADLPSVNSLLLNNLCMTVAGLAIILTPFASSYAGLMVVAGVFGITSAAFISLTSIVLCDLLGLGKLTNAFGLLSMGRGVAGILGPPIAGAVFQSTGSYNASFFLGGSLFLAGTVLHFVLFLPCMRSRKMKEVELKTIQEEESEQKMS